MYIWDIQDLNAELEPEDVELMQMFSQSRQRELNNMVLVQQGKRLYLERKDLRAIRFKRLTAALKLTIFLLAILCAVNAVRGALSPSGNPWAWYVGFLLCALSGLLKIPAEVKF